MLSRVAVAAVSAGLIVGGALSGAGGLLGELAFVGHAQAQQGPGEVLYRIERLENQIRQMTGEIEQLQYRNQQLEAALNELRGGGRAAAAPPPGAMASQQPGAMMAPPMQQSPGGPPPAVYGGNGRRGDAFDPTANPSAPGAPRMLGSMPPQLPPPGTRPGMEPTPYANVAATPDQDYERSPGGPPPQPGYPPVANAAPPPPQATPRDIFDAGVASLRRRDYAAAEESFRDLVTRFPSDRLAAEAQYNVGESLFQRQDYQQAASAFIALTKKYENSTKAPDGLLRLGQSLAAMNETDLACVAFADVARKYPRARSEVRQAVDREQKRARCTN